MPLLTVLLLLVAGWLVLPAAETQEQIQALIKGKTAAEALGILKGLDAKDAWVIFYTARMESDAARAVELYKQITQSHPEHEAADDALYEVAQYNYAKGYYVSAVKLYQDLVTLYPKSQLGSQALYWGAACYLATKQPDAARTLYEKYLSRYTTTLDEAVHLGIGDSYLIEKEYEKGLNAYNIMLNSFPQGELTATAYYRISECYAILGREDRATEYLNRIAQEYPQSYYATRLKKATPQEAITTLIPEEVMEPLQGGFVVQVGAYSAPQNARNLTQKLTGLGYPAEVSVQIVNAQQYFKVWVGPYPTREEAKKQAEELKTKEKLDYFILKKDK